MGRLTTPAILFAISAFCFAPHSQAAALHEGDRGERVQQVQELLIERGLLDGTADGVYGADTAEAIKAFQASVGLAADGVCGDQTFAMLSESDQSDVNQFDQSDDYAIKLGSSGADVAEVQNILIAMGYMNGKADGVCGAGTVAAIKEFQASAGLTADGVAGAHTLDMLAEAAQNFERAKAPKSPVTEAPPVTKTVNSEDQNTYADVGSVIKSGMRGDGVVDVQEKLIALGYMSGKADGVCGAATVEAIKKFQASVGLPADGVCGLMTYAALEDASYDTSDTTWEDVLDYERDFGRNATRNRSIYVDATAYSAYDPGNGSYTARGSLLRRGIIAVDPSVIPLGTRVYIPGYGEAIADDTGGAIVGNRIDIAFDSHEEAIYFGRQMLEIYIIE